MSKDEFFTDSGRNFSEKLVELAIELNPSERERFFDYIEGVVAGIKMEKKTQNKEFV